jgi:hypothetical protein
MRARYIVEPYVAVNIIKFTVTTEMQQWGAFTFLSSCKIYLGLQTEYPVFVYDFNKIWVLLTGFNKSFRIKFKENPSSGSRADT